MSKYNTSGHRTQPAAVRASSPLGTVSRTAPDTRTYEGGAGWMKDPRTDLFIRSTSSFHGNEKSFYEDGKVRDQKIIDLVRQLAVEDWDWTAQFLAWLRGPGNIRTAALILACEAVDARLKAGLKAPENSVYPSNREVIGSVLQRADEPGEMLAYWTANHGRAIPKPMKRGIADAVQRLYNERCVTTNTLVLKRDLSWVRAGDLDVGDELVGFDEQVRSSIKGGASKMRVATVMATRRVMLPSVRVKTNKGESSVSADHQFVISSDRKRTWRSAGDLKPGDKLIFFGEPWRQDHSRDAGWMAGFLDGEGSVTQKCVQVSQVVGETCEYAKEVLKRLGFEFSVQQYQAQGNRQLKETLKILGGRYASMRLLGTVGGVRLSRDRLWLDGDLVSKGPWVEPGSAWATVESVDDLGLQENVTMSTSTKTFISDGFLSHNSLLKYDTASKGYRFGDILNLVHAAPDPDKPWQGDLFHHALDRRHNPDTAEIPTSLGILKNNKDMRESDDASRWLDAEALRDSGMTWENAFSSVGSKVDKAKLWESMIPSMGIMAAIRNLRNFDEAGVSDQAAQQIINRLMDPDEIARSRQLPFRFLSAYKNAPSLRWAHALETALSLCLPNVPVLDGRTLVLVDSSGSMSAMMSGKSSLSCLSGAALFGAVTALRNAGNADLHHFADQVEPIPVPRGGSVLRLAKTVESMRGRVGYGTSIGSSVRRTYQGHNRVLIFSDGVTFGGYGDSYIAASVPPDVPVYLFNLRGYSESPMPTGSAARFDLGGLTDATFALIPRLEAGMRGVWPWELADAS